MFEKFIGTHHGLKINIIYFSGTFRWSPEKDKLLLREVRYICNECAYMKNQSRFPPFVSRDQFSCGQPSCNVGLLSTLNQFSLWTL